MGMMEFYVGIDPGKTGGLVCLHIEHGIASSMVMPSRISEVINWLNQLPITRTMVILEKAQAMPKNGAVSMFNYGVGYGELLGVLATLRLPYANVAPIVWTKIMHSGIPRSISAKERSLRVFGQLFPGIDLKATAKCKKQHDGLIDALLLAEFGRRQYHRTLN